MSLRSAAHTVRNALRPGYARVMATKLRRRMSPEERSQAEAVEWAAARRVSPPDWCRAVDAELWAESQEFGRTLRARAKDLAESTGLPVGGGARVELLYFVTRLTAPHTVVETGVAAGFSSTAFLTAMERNGHGHLWSSDFPYFREVDPEAFVGILVPDHLQARWTLRVRGDEHNLPEILDEITTIDLLHYDSDKSYAGRRYAIDTLTPRLSDGAVVMMDDIQDNVFFRDYTTERDEPFVVFGRGRFCVGAIGLPGSPDVPIN